MSLINIEMRKRSSAASWLKRPSRRSQQKWTDRQFLIDILLLREGILTFGDAFFIILPKYPLTLPLRGACTILPDEIKEGNIYE